MKLLELLPNVAQSCAADTSRLSVDVARARECAVDEFDMPATSKVKLRCAMLTSPDRGSVFDKLLALSDEDGAARRRECANMSGGYVNMISFAQFNELSNATI
jgi:hypothetical protein